MEAPAVSWLFPGQEMRVETRCLHCAEPIAVRVKDGKILDATPDTAVLHTNLPLRDWRDSWPHA